MYCIVDRVNSVFTGVCIFYKIMCDAKIKHNISTDKSRANHLTGKHTMKCSVTYIGHYQLLYNINICIVTILNFSHHRLPYFINLSELNAHFLGWLNTGVGTGY